MPCPSHCSLTGPLYFSCWPAAGIHIPIHSLYPPVWPSSLDIQPLKRGPSNCPKGIDPASDAAPHHRRTETSTAMLQKPTNLHSPRIASLMLYTSVLSFPQSYIASDTANQNFPDTEH
jgi:hypothetical protein